MTRTSLAVLALGSALCAQVPYGHFVVSARNAAAVGTGAYLVDAGTGDVTPLLGLTATAPTLTTIATLALEPTTGDLLVSGGIASSIQPTFYRLTLSGRTAGQLRRVSVTGFAGAVADLAFDPSGQILFCSAASTTAGGLWRAAPTGGAATQLGQVPGATEVISTAQAAFVLTRQVGVPSTVWRYDYTTAAWGQVVGNLPEATAFDVYAGPLLLVGTQAGQLYLADTITGAANLFGTASPSAITALRVAPQTGVALILDAAGDLRDIGGAVLASVNPNLSDVDVGTLDQAVFFTFGAGCAGSNSQTPAITSNGPPAIPSASFAVNLGNAPANAPALHVLGSSRRSWSGIPLPIDLGSAGAPGCAILCNPLLLSFLVANGGGQASVPLPIPNDLTLRSARVMNQWWIVDPTANPLGLTVSDGGEAVLR